MKKPMTKEEKNVALSITIINLFIITFLIICNWFNYERWVSFHLTIVTICSYILGFFFGALLFSYLGSVSEKKIKEEELNKYYDDNRKLLEEVEKLRKN